MHSVVFSPLLFRFYQIGSLRGVRSWAEHKATQSLTFIPAGRSESSRLTVALFSGRGREMKQLYLNVRNVKNLQIIKSKGIISTAMHQHPAAPAYFPVVQPINKHSTAILFIEDQCTCIYT